LWIRVLQKGIIEPSLAAPQNGSPWELKVKKHLNEAKVTAANHRRFAQNFSLLFQLHSLLVRINSLLRFLGNLLVTQGNDEQI
jgi:hypothetical protein